MNSGRPFQIEGRNTVNEVVYTTRPAIFGDKYLTIRQSSGRSYTDTDQTYVSANSNNFNNFTSEMQPKYLLKPNIHSTYLPTNTNDCLPNNSFNYCNCKSLIMPNIEYVPGGVQYSFNLQGETIPRSKNNFGHDILVLNDGLPFIGNIHVHDNLVNTTPRQNQNLKLQQMNFQQPKQSHEQQYRQDLNRISMKKLEKMNEDIISFHNFLNRNSPTFKFHYDTQTDTLDLNQISKGRPDFRNISGIMTQKYGFDLKNIEVFDSTQNKSSQNITNIRRLHLTTSSDLEQGSTHLKFTPSPEEMQKPPQETFHNSRDNLKDSKDEKHQDVNQVEYVTNEVQTSDNVEDEKSGNENKDDNMYVPENKSEEEFEAQFFGILEESVKDAYRILFAEDDVEENPKKRKRKNKDVNTDSTTNKEEKSSGTNKSVTFGKRYFENKYKS